MRQRPNSLRTRARFRRGGVGSALLLCMVCCSLARADFILVPLQAEAVAGEPVRIDLLVTNETEEPTSVAIPDRLSVRLSNAEQAFNVELERDPTAAGGELQLPAHGVRRIPYHAVLPAPLRGVVTLRALDLVAAPAMLDVAPAAEPPIAQALPEATESPAPTSPDGEVPLSRNAAFAAALSAYEPVYIAAGGSDGTNAKFQLSLKFRFFNERAGLARRIDFLEHLYFGYTQTSLWDLHASSAPFDDTSYKPRLFYFDPSVWTPPSSPLRLGVETGLGHESNGRDGDDSRSINIAYVRPVLVLGRPGEWQLTLAPMLMHYLEEEVNVSDYRGYVDWQVSLGKADSAQLAALYRDGEKGWSVQLDLTYPLRSIALGNLNGYLHFQYFDGWGESFLNYDQRGDPQYRLGLMFIR
jgi:phospholipase A1/A2